MAKSDEDKDTKSTNKSLNYLGKKGSALYDPKTGKRVKNPDKLKVGEIRDLIKKHPKFERFFG